MIRRGASDSPYETGTLNIAELEAGSHDAPFASNTDRPRWLPWPLGIRGRLLLLVFTSTLPLLVVAWINLEHRFRDQSLQARQHALTLARMASNRVDDHIRSVDALLVAIGKSISVKDSDAEFNDRFLGTIQKDLPPFFSSLGVFAPDGHGIGTSLLSLTDRSRLTAAGRDYLFKALAARSLSIGEPVVSRATNAWTCIISRPVMSPENDVLALVYAAMRLDRLQVLLDPGEMPRGTILALVDKNGTILARTVDPEKWVGRSIAHYPQFETASRDREGTAELVGLDGIQRLIGYTFGKQTTWMVTVGIPSEAAYGPIKRDFRRNLLLGLTTLSAALLVAWSLAGRITRPLLQLSADSRAIGAGNLAHRSQVHSHDEVGKLATTFNQMSATLESRTAALRESEAALRKQTEVLESILHSMGDGVLVVDQTGKFVVFNEAAGRLYGSSPQDADANQWAASHGLCRPDMVTSFPAEEIPLSRAMKGDSVDNVEMFISRQDTPPGVRVSATARPLKDREGRILGAVVVLRDITRQHQLEEQLRQSQRMESIGKLAGGVAHDFNNLLTAILGYAALLLDNLPADSDAHRDAEQIQKASERAAALTRQLLAFSRKQILQARVVDINGILLGMEPMLHRLIGEDIKLFVLPADSLAKVKADPTQVEQIILNLVINARDAMPKGGRLTIETANAILDQSQVERHVDVPPGPYVVLAVSDTGCGMDPETQARIFEPFFTTKPAGQGTGMGLATVYGIVKQSGGHAWVYSEPGQGTSLKIYLPQSEPGERQQGMPSTFPAISRATGSETILLVEDEQTVRDLAGAVLTKSGYTVLAAADGEDALRLSKSHAGDIQLMITDAIMPGMRGHELGDVMRKLRPQIKILFISGYTDDAAIHKGVLVEGIQFLQKPFTPDALALKVRTVLDME